MNRTRALLGVLGILAALALVINVAMVQPSAPNTTASAEQQEPSIGGQVPSTGVPQEEVQVDLDALRRTINPGYRERFAAPQPLIIPQDYAAMMAEQERRNSFSTNNFGTARVPSADFHYRQENQRMQDRVDRQDSRAMQQMQRDARFRNRMNEYNFRHGGR